MSLIENHALRTLIKGKTATWVVTGAGGFIGSHISSHLLCLGQNVIAIDNLSTGKRENIDYLYSVCRDCDPEKGDDKKIDTKKEECKLGTFSFYENDIADFNSIKDLFLGADVVLHEAALGSVPRSVEQPLASHDANVTGFLNVLEAAKLAGIKRVVYASSSSVYGDSPVLPKVECDIGAVLSPYAATKRCNEVYSEAYSACYDLTLVGLRYFNVFGPRQDPKGAYAAVIPRWIETLKDDKVACTVYGDGTTSRDFCFVDNVVIANLLAALHPELKSGSHVFNVGCGGQTTLKELQTMLSESVRLLLGKDSMPAPLFEDFRKGDVKHSLADISQIEQKLGFRPIVTVEEGIGRTVASFFKSNA